MLRNLLLILIFCLNLNVFALAPNEKKLFEAIENNNIESEFKGVFKYKINLNIPNDNELNPLLYPIYKNNERVVKILLKNKEANIGHKLPNNNTYYPEDKLFIKSANSHNNAIGRSTPLIYAIFKSNENIFKRLIDAGANIKTKNKKDVTDFVYASGFGNGNIIRTMLVKDGKLSNDKTLNNTNGSNYAAYERNEDAYNTLVKLAANEKNEEIGNNYEVKPEYVLSATQDSVNLESKNYKDNNENNSEEENIIIVKAINDSDTNTLKNIMMYSNFNMNSAVIKDETPLLYAISSGKYEAVKELVNFKIYNTNIIDIEKTTLNKNNRKFDAEYLGNNSTVEITLGDASPLQYAIYNFYNYRDTNIINELLENGADIFRKDIDGNDSMMYASKFASSEVIDIILNKAKNSYRAVDIYGNTVLHNAAIIGNTNSLNALLNKTPLNINAQNINGDTPLHLAVKNNNTNTYKFLLSKGVDYNIKNYDGKTASDFMYEDNIENILTNNINSQNINDIQNVKSDIADNLIDEYIDEENIESEDNNTEPEEYIYDANKELFNAIYSNSTDGIKIAISNGADINFRNDEGLTPLLYAIDNSKIESVKTILSYETIDIEMPLNNYTNYYLSEGKNIKEELIFDGTTPLQYAVFKGNVDIINLMLEKNPNLTKKDLNGCSVILYASAFSNNQIVEMLINKNYKLADEKSSNGITALHAAALFANDKVIEYYLNNTFLNINAQDNTGNTPLHYASEKGHNSTINLLINSGAKKNIENVNGIKAYDN